MTPAEWEMQGYPLMVNMGEWDRHVSPELHEQLSKWVQAAMMEEVRRVDEWIMRTYHQSPLAAMAVVQPPHKYSPGGLGYANCGKCGQYIQDGAYSEATGFGWCSRCGVYSDGQCKTYAPATTHLVARAKGMASIAPSCPTCPSCRNYNVHPNGWCDGCGCYTVRGAVPATSKQALPKSAAAVYRCADCKDTGKVTLFTSTGTCRACGGKSCSS